MLLVVEEVEVVMVVSLGRGLCKIFICCMCQRYSARTEVENDGEGVSL